jgi:secondary thiamine-phosphate synthase enzyme
MPVKTAEIYVNKDKEEMLIERLTHEVDKAIRDSNIRTGIATVFVGCTTASISTMEFTPEGIKDIKVVLEKIAPVGIDYMHHKTVGDSDGVGADYNGASHIRSTFMGPSVTVPFKDHRLMLDKGIDIVLMDFDMIKRKRKVIIQLIGE